MTHPWLLSGMLIAFTVLLFACAQEGLERQTSWDLARAKNRCAWGYQAYCQQLAEMRR